MAALPLPLHRRYIPCKFLWSRNYILCLLALLPPLLTVQSAAQKVLSATPGDSSPTQCQVRVVENKVVASNRERHEVSYHVQPPGIIPDPKVWGGWATLRVNYASDLGLNVRQE